MSFPILQRCDAVGPAKELDVVRLVIVSHSFTQFCNLYIYQQDIGEVEAQLEQNYKMLRRLITKLSKIH